MISEAIVTSDKLQALQQTASRIKKKVFGFMAKVATL